MEHGTSKPTAAIGVAGLAALLAGGLLLYWYYDLGHEPAEKVRRLHGKTVEEVAAELGAADDIYCFTMDEPLGEFQIELYNTYPPGRPGNANVEIQEMHWQRSRHTLTIWFHKVDGEWVALDTCRWKKGLQF